jgi:PAS domain S-box-containing protein
MVAPAQRIDISSLLEGIPHAAMILDDSFGVVRMNRLLEALTGYRSEDVAGIHGELVVRTGTGNNRGQLYKKVLQTGEPCSCMGDLINANRRKVPIQYTISALLDEKNREEQCGLLVIAEDISQVPSTVETGVLQSDSIELIGYSPKMQEVFNLIPLMSQTDASVMITGETGTGKDKIAEIIHKKSARSRYPFIKVNCGALPSGLLESELFGHVKGAFTGATRNKQGMFELADKGTLFLTEIGDMPLPLQVKLLSVLDDNEFVPVGGEKKVNVDVRIIAATHRPLREQIKVQQFREDLFYRLHVLHIHLPPLREREEDIRYLIGHFLEKFTQALGKSIVGFTPEAMQVLMNYNYPGNIRELRNIVEYAANVSTRKKVSANSLPPYIFEQQSTDNEPVQQPAAAESVGSKAAAIEGNEGKNQESWEEIERNMIVEALKEHGGSRTKCSESLGWGRMKLWRKMKHYNLL